MKSPFPAPHDLRPVLLGVLFSATAICSLPAEERPDAVGGELPPAVLRATVGETDGGTAPAPAPASGSNATEAIRLDVQGAVLLALERNAAFRLERLSPGIARTREREARAAFDPVLSGSLTKTDLEAGTNEVAEGDTLGASVGLRELLPTGTAFDIGVAQIPATAGLSAHTSYDVKVTQALLRGFGTGANMARLRQARLDTLSSAYELRGVAEALIAQVESAYWDHVLAERSIAIYTQSLEIAEQQVAETTERIRVGNMAETELAAVEAELASRRERLIDARSSLAKSRLLLLRLVNPAIENPFAGELVLTQSPETEGEGAAALDDAQAHVALGLKQRPDLNQARLAVSRGELEVVRTRNGALPKLDLFVRLGGTRYAESFPAAGDEDWSREVQAGVLLEYPLGNRAERASRDRAGLSLEQVKGAMENMRQLVEVDIRVAYLEVERAGEQVKATEATRRRREETARTEMEKLRVGKSTSLLVAQSSRDLVESQIACVRAVIAYRRALLDLYRLEGSLLDRRGIQSDAEAS